MFMASNQFKVIKGREEAFENAWAETSGRLRKAAGLISFRFHKGTEFPGHVLYFTITMWEAEACFLDWKRAELFGGYEMSRSASRRLASSRPEEFDAMVAKSNPQ